MPSFTHLQWAQALKNSNNSLNSHIIYGKAFHKQQNYLNNVFGPKACEFMSLSNYIELIYIYMDCFCQNRFAFALSFGFILLVI